VKCIFVYNLCKTLPFNKLDVKNPMEQKGNISKKELVDEIALRTGLTQVDVKLVVECLLDSIASAMMKGRRIEIRGFGRFKVKERKARLARNPKTGEPISLPPTITPLFEPSRELKQSVHQALSSTLPRSFSNREDDR